jgi:hypothetical protein
MNKIPTVFERDWDGDRSRVVSQVHPGCEWVLAGEGVATRKYDGTCVMFDGTDWWARREVKEGKTPPAGWYAVSHDDVTGKNVGWEPIEGSPFAKFHAEAVAAVRDQDSGIPFPAGTYELIGPKVQGNPEKSEAHALVLHTNAEPFIVPRTFDGMRELLGELDDIEGFVFHHEDGRMAKIKKRDFGLRRG